MEELSTPLIDNASAELWILNQSQSRQSPQLIGDDLIKKWSKGLFDLSGKKVVGRFCLLNGFVSPLVTVILEDLEKGTPLPWDIVFELVKLGTTSIGKDLVDSLLSGATRDKDLRALSIAALSHEHNDPRWKKIFKSEQDEYVAELKKKRKALFEEVQIFSNEGMQNELAETLQKIFKLFPHDQEAMRLFSALKEKEVDQSLEKIKKTFERRVRPRTEKQATETWKELHDVLPQALPSLSLDTLHEMALGLFQMGLGEDALNILQSRRDQFTDREKFLEIEILLFIGNYAEALQATQVLIREAKDVPDKLEAALYFSAKAYYGLEDLEQAISILKALAAHRPDFRDVNVLLSQWKREAI